MNKAQAMRGGMLSNEFADFLISSTLYAIQSIANGQSDCLVATVAMRQETNNQLVLESGKDQFAFYPNPAVGGSTLNLIIPGNPTGANQVLQIIEIASGKVLYSKLFSANAQRFSLSNRLAAGSYVIRLSGNPSTKPLKLVVIK